MPAAWSQDDEAEPEFDPARPLLSVYGPAAPTREGDYDHRQIIYFSVPSDHADRFFVRVFDPDTVAEHDTPFGAHNDTRTRFSVFGGDGAVVPDTRPEAVEDDARLSSGELLHEATFGASRRDSDKWHTLAEIDPALGQRHGDAAVFRLVVRTLSGNDGNIFSLALSASDEDNVAVAGARLYAHVPTIRVPDDRGLTELRFRIPEDATELNVHNFDASFGSVVFTSAFRSLTLGDSGQDVWRVTPLDITPHERGQMAALTFMGGEEIPNDVTAYVNFQGSDALQIELPPRLWLPNARPEIALTMRPLDCTSVSFSAAGSSDADGHELSYLWRFGTDQTETGLFVLRQFSGPGSYRARLEVTDASGLIGNGTAQDFSVNIKPPPVALASSPSVVAPGEPVTFDGTASSAGEFEIAAHHWTLQDGTGLNGAAVTTVFDRPGVYRADLEVTDASGHPCNTDRASTEVLVNARPVAEAGDDRFAAAGAALTFDAGASRDGDGSITEYLWDLGDGTVKHGARVGHAYPRGGAYVVRLRATDDSGASNAVGLDTARVVVNARPVARAGSDLTVTAGETLTFDGSRSSDLDGDPLTFVWDFGDGRTSAGSAPSHAYEQKGTYVVRLTVRDGSGLSNASHDDTLTVTVKHPGNAAPVAAAGADVTAIVGEVVSFDASRSRDPDGDIVSFAWDFGDGGRTAGIAPIHTYWQPGEYSVQLTVTDDFKPQAATASDQLTVRVSIRENTAPVAAAGPDLSARVGEVISFDASRSQDPDGNLVAYDWSFGDGGTARGVRPIHAYHHPGEYSVELTVRDDGPVARSAIDMLTVKVEAR